MRNSRRQFALRSLGIITLGAGILAFCLTRPEARGEGEEDQRIQHVLLLSVDGLHAVDLANYVAGHPQSALARLSANGITYTRASTSKPSDSFPGLISMITGGSPGVTGV